MYREKYKLTKEKCSHKKGCEESVTNMLTLIV